jgi:hypothetical protein
MFQPSSYAVAVNPFPRIFAPRSPLQPHVARAGALAPFVWLGRCAPSDDEAERDGDLRVVDESGEDYLFAADRFVAIEVPTAVRASLLKASRA